MESDSRHQTNLYQNVIVAFTGAIITTFCITPMDVIKTKLQVQSLEILEEIKCENSLENGNKNYNKCTQLYGIDKYRGQLKRIIINIQKNDGIKGFWSGLKPTLFAALPATITFYTTYESIKTELMRFEWYRNIPYVTIINPIIASIPARSIATIVGVPFDAMRIQMQARNLSYEEIYTVLKTMVQRHGVKSLWCGLTPMILRDVPFSAIYWTSYETIKFQVIPSKLTHGFTFTAGAASGALAAIITTPLDVMCTYMQVDKIEQFRKKNKYKPTTLRDYMLNLYYDQGFRGLFTGLSMRLLKVIPGCGIMISVLEIGNYYFLNRKEIISKEI